MNKELIQLRLTTAWVSNFATSCFVCRLQDCFLVSRVFMGDSCCFRKMLGLHSLSYALPLRRQHRVRKQLTCWRSRRLFFDEINFTHPWSLLSKIIRAKSKKHIQTHTLKSAQRVLRWSSRSFLNVYVCVTQSVRAHVFYFLKIRLSFSEILPGRPKLMSGD